MVHIRRVCALTGERPHAVIEGFAESLGLEFDTDELLATLDEDSETALLPDTFNPDYGLMLVQQLGFTQDHIVTFADFTLDNVANTGATQFTASKAIELGDATYAISFDFSLRILGDILQFTSNQNANQVIKWLKAGCRPSSMDLSVPIRVAIVSKVGEVQHNAKESFVPLIIQSVSAPP